MRSIFFLSIILLVFSACKKKDTSPPLIEFLSPDTIHYYLNDTFNLPQVAYYDDRTCKFADKTSINNSVNTSEYGLYHVVYTAEDEAGNSTEEILNVVVKLRLSDYYALEYDGRDSCTSGIYEYSALLQNCNCEDSIVEIFNLGGFGPGTKIDLMIDGMFNEQITIDQRSGDVQFTGKGIMSTNANKIELEYIVDNDADTDHCFTTLIKN